MSKTISNPFSPGKIMIDSTRYAGRDDLIVEAYEYLQNQRSIFITGQRGVGKSSFAMQLKNIMNYHPDAIDRFDFVKGMDQLNPMIISYRCTGHENIEDIISGLLQGLSQLLNISCNRNEKLITKWKIDLKVFSHENCREESHLTPSITNIFSEAIIDGFNNEPDLYSRGICFVIDEIDMIIARVELGILIKVFLENLSDAGIQSVTFVLVGISKGLNVLKQQHPSITRYLVPIYVPPMNNIEMNDILDRALFNTEIFFNAELRETIHMLSQGFPDPVQLIGFEIFNTVIKNNAAADFKVLEEVLKKITTSLKREEFITVKNKIPNLNCEKLLLEMARINNEYVTVSQLYEVLRIPDNECNQLCKELVDNNFLEQQGLGVYRFTDPLFRVYLNMVNVDREVKAERARIFNEVNSISYKSNIPIDEEVFLRDKVLYEIILRNYERTGKSGFWKF